MLSFFGASQLRLFGSIFVLLTGLTYFLYLFHDALPIVKDLDYFRDGNGNFSIPYQFETALQHDPPPGSRPYGSIVIAAQPSTDVSWTPWLTVDWTVYEYDVDQPDNPDPSLRFPKSKGHEAMVYLSFIIDNYDDLPWCTIFIHGHRDGVWHQEDDMVNIIGSLNRVALARAGYVSLRCDWYPSCPAEMRPLKHDAVIWGPQFNTRGTEAAIAGNWKMLFPGEKLPETIASQCCAQFAVTRQAIMRRPKTDYERLREWLLSSLLGDDISGRVIEKLWAYIFLGEAVHCPPPQQCACEYFGRCEEKEWRQPPDGLAPLPAWP